MVHEMIFRVWNFIYFFLLLSPIMWSQFGRWPFQLIYLSFKSCFGRLLLNLIRLVLIWRLSGSWRWIIQVILVMKDHWIKEFIWIANYITLYLSFINVRVLMISIIHSLIMVFLGTTPFFNNDCFLFHWELFSFIPLNVLLNVEFPMFFLIQYLLQRWFRTLYFLDNQWNFLCFSFLLYCD